MKAGFYRFWSSRSFTRSLSIVAVAVVAFAALGLLAVQPALANVWCCGSTTCICDAQLVCPAGTTNTFKSCGVAGTTALKGTVNSTIECTGVSGGNFWTNTTVGRDAILYCNVQGSADPLHNGHAFCKLDLLYSRPAGLVTACTSVPNSTDFIRSHVAFCDQVSGGNANNRLTVTGTLDCNHPNVQGLNSSTPDPVNMPVDLLSGIPKVCGGNAEPCTLNLGIAGQGGQCSTLFPDGSNEDPSVPDLAEGQVLHLSQTFANSSCTDPPTSISELQTRYCNGGSFNGTPVDCTFGTGKTQQNATIVGTADNALAFDVDFNQPPVHNVGCTGGGQSNDLWDFTIFGNEQLNVALIDQTTLKIEAVSPSTPINCGGPVNNTLTCLVKMCPDVAPVVAAASFPVGTKDFVNITVTGELTSGTPIIGEKLIEVNGL